MSGTFSPSIRIGRPPSKTNSGAAPTNASGIVTGDSYGAFTASQEFWVYQPNAVAGNLGFYKVGVNGTGFVGNAINIPNLTNQSLVIATLPGGARINNISVNPEQAPTVINTGLLTFSLNGTAIATYVITANTITSGFVTFNNTLIASQLQAYVGATDAVLTVALSATGAITGGYLAEISVNYTARNIDGSIRAVGRGTTNSGAGAAVN